MRKLTVVLMLLLAMVLAACTPAAGTGGDATTPTEVPAETGGDDPAPTEAPMDGGTDEMYTCEDALGCVEIPAGEPIKLASALVISGENASLGLDSQNGVELAIEARGQIKGHDVTLVKEDDGCSPEGGQTVGQRIAADTTIVAAIGTSCSGAARSAIPLITGAGLTMISPSATAPDLTGDARAAEYAGFLRTAHNDSFQGAVAAQFAYNELGARTAATIHDGSVYAESLQQVFADEFTALGGTITNQEAVNVGDTDMTSVLTTIGANAPDILYFPTFTAESAFITTQAADAEGLEETALMSADGSFSIDYVKNAGAAAENVYLSGPFVQGAAYDEFVAAHETKYGTKPPSGFHAHAYDAANILMNAIDAVSVEAGGTLYIPRQALRDAVYATSGFEGLTGVLACQPTGDCATGEALAVFQLTPEIASDPDANWPPAPIFQP
jgi:branched-chain amino acid transport system substrate-binding protein